MMLPLRLVATAIEALVFSQKSRRMLCTAGFFIGFRLASVWLQEALAPRVRATPSSAGLYFGSSRA
ncbi:MAG: hypothetical protein KBG72_13320, partial [Agrobacterium sp.]|nr:hypothetical protein [Agrobacterium sp.]